MTVSQNLFEFHQVSYRYPPRQYEEKQADVHMAVRDISLSIGMGEYVAIVGPNGSGKSTMAKLMTGLLSPTNGGVTLFHQPIEAYVERGDLPEYVGMVFQDPDTQSVATVVAEDVAFSLENLQVPHDEMHRRVEEALRLVDMWDHRDREPHSLSGGQKQRVAVASVIAADPKCIIFDEATSMLDSIGRQEVTQLMQRLYESGHTIITITHHMDEVLGAKRVVVLDAGQIAFDGTPGELFADARKLSQFHLGVPMPALASDVLRKHGFADVPGVVHAEQFARVLSRKRVSGQRALASDRTLQIRLENTGVESASHGEIVMDIRQLHHTYMRGTPMEARALEGVSLEVERGQIVAIVGATGSGKSTFSLYLNGLYTSDQGTVCVLGMDTADKVNAKAIRKRVGMLFQKSEAQIFEALIGDEIAYGAFKFGATVDSARGAVQDAMALVDLDFDWRDRPTYALSGGQKRKVALASVLAIQPEILVLDEPTSALDPQAREELLSLLRKLCQERNMTILFVTHQLEEVANLADRVVVFERGRIVADTTPNDWLQNPEEVTRLGFRLPEAPEYIMAVCQSLHMAPPQPMPLTMLEAEGWLSSLAGDETWREEEVEDGEF